MRLRKPARPIPTISALLFLALGACQQGRDDSNIAIDNGSNGAASEVVTAPEGQPANIAEPDQNVNTAAAPIIPIAYRGRWGMVAADCTSTRGDAKGLMTIGETSIRFYESTATLKTVRPALATSFSGSYGFAGEGQRWDKIVTLTRTGDRLQRADDEGRTTYQRCA